MRRADQSALTERTSAVTCAAAMVPSTCARIELVKLTMSALAVSCIASAPPTPKMIGIAMLPGVVRGMKQARKMKAGAHSSTTMPKSCISGIATSTYSADSGTDHSVPLRKPLMAGTGSSIVENRMQKTAAIIGMADPLGHAVAIQNTQQTSTASTVEKAESTAMPGSRCSTRLPSAEPRRVTGAPVRPRSISLRRRAQSRQAVTRSSSRCERPMRNARCHAGRARSSLPRVRMAVSKAPTSSTGSAAIQWSTRAITLATSSSSPPSARATRPAGLPRRRGWASAMRRRPASRSRHRRSSAGGSRRKARASTACAIA
jgi:hypothetical protein